MFFNVGFDILVGFGFADIVLYKFLRMEIFLRISGSGTYIYLEKNQSPYFAAEHRSDRQLTPILATGDWRLATGDEAREGRSGEGGGGNNMQHTI
jgi:hypothetical protein